VDDIKKRPTILAQRYRDTDEPQAWCEALYVAADGDADAVPWADLVPNSYLVSWLDDNYIDGAGRRALVIGSGLGDDAEELRRRGFAVVAFDLSPTAIEWCRRRFPESEVEYRVDDLFTLPDSWSRCFDFVFESYTLQVFPEERRARAMHRIADLLAPDAALLVICRGREPDQPLGDLPWPLTINELQQFERAGLTARGISDQLDEHEDRTIRRFVVEYSR